MSSSGSRAPRPWRVPFPIFDDDPSGAAVDVPPGHFLAQREVSPPVQSDNNDDWLAGAMPDTASLAAADYDVSVVSGFLPPDEPVQRLDGEWDAYEALLDKAQEQVKDLSSGGVGRISDEWRTELEQVSRLNRGQGQARPRHKSPNADPIQLMCGFSAFCGFDLWIDYTAPASSRPRAAVVPGPLLHSLVLPLPEPGTARGRGAVGPGE